MLELVTGIWPRNYVPVCMYTYKSEQIKSSNTILKCLFNLYSIKFFFKFYLNYGSIEFKEKKTQQIFLQFLVKKPAVHHAVHKPYSHVPEATTFNFWLMFLWCFPYLPQQYDYCFAFVVVMICIC